MNCETCGIKFLQTLPDQKECFVCGILRACKNFPSGIYNEDEKKYFKRIQIKSSWEKAKIKREII